jgi:hypothetical protein
MTLEALKATPRVKSIQRAALAMLVLAGVHPRPAPARTSRSAERSAQRKGGQQVAHIRDRQAQILADQQIGDRERGAVDVVDALIGVASAGSYLFVVDQPITAAEIDAVSQHGAAPAPAAGG